MTFSIENKKELDALTSQAGRIHANFEEVDLTPEQAKQWDITRSKLSNACPAFTHIFYTMLVGKAGKNLAVFTRGVDRAATDGRSLLFNPDVFFQWSLDERVFVIAHEILHCVFRHCDFLGRHLKNGQVKLPDGKSLPLSPELLNVAQDFIINDMLIKGRVGKAVQNIVHDANFATETDDHIEVYKKLVKNAKGGGCGGGGTGKPFDTLLPPPPGAPEKTEREWKQAVAAGLSVAKAMGRLPKNLEAIFGEVLEPKVDWTDKLRAFFARKIGGETSNWRRPDRRHINRDLWLPSRGGNGSGTIVVGFDTSGSIYGDKGTLERFIAEVGGILSDLKPKALHIVWCDAEVHRVDEVDELTDLQGLRPLGGGGTSFVPVFDWIDENLDPSEIDGLVYLTDGYGSFPSVQPRYPVLWGSIALAEGDYPFGDVVMVPRGD